MDFLVILYTSYVQFILKKGRYSPEDEKNDDGDDWMNATYSLEGYKKWMQPIS